MANSHYADKMLARMEKDAVTLGYSEAFDPPKYVGMDPQGKPVLLPRWRIDAKWIEFECGCRAEKFTKLSAPTHHTDPIIFENLPEQALYDYVCHHHTPAMNKRVHLNGFVDFAQWHRSRRSLLLGK